MDLDFIAKLCLCGCSLIGFCYGAAVFLSKKAPLYAKMITGAVGCMMFGSLLAVVRRLAGFEERAFQLDHLAYIGVFLFFFTANVGIMDGLADGKLKRFLKYRLISLGAPLVIALLFVPVLLSDLPVLSKAIYGVVSLFAAASSYFNFKHAIIPDVEFGVIRCVRGYNLLAFAFAVLYAGNAAVRALGFKWASLILSVLIAADAVLILPLLKRGIDRWKTI